MPVLSTLCSICFEFGSHPNNDNLYLSLHLHWVLPLSIELSLCLSPGVTSFVVLVLLISIYIYISVPLSLSSLLAALSMVYNCSSHNWAQRFPSYLIEKASATSLTQPAPLRQHSWPTVNLLSMCFNRFGLVRPFSHAPSRTPC